MGSKKMSVDLEFVRSLAELITETDLNEIEIEEDDIRIRLATWRRNICVRPGLSAAFRRTGTGANICNFHSTRARSQ